MLLDSLASLKDHVSNVGRDLDAATKSVLAGRASLYESEGFAKILGTDSKGRSMLPKGAVGQVDADEGALVALATLAADCFVDMEGRVLRRPDLMMRRKLERQPAP